MRTSGAETLSAAGNIFVGQTEALDCDPDRRHRRHRAFARSDLARVGMRAMIAGSLAGFMTATIAGMLV